MFSYFGNVDFELDLVCLPLVHMDFIFGMDWMLDFGVNINCLTKSVTFSKRVDGVGGKFLSTEQVKKSLDGEACNALFIYLIILLDNIVYYYILYDFW